MKAADDRLVDLDNLPTAYAPAKVLTVGHDVDCVVAGNLDLFSLRNSVVEDAHDQWGWLIPRSHCRNALVPATTPMIAAATREKIIGQALTCWAVLAIAGPRLSGLMSQPAKFIPSAAAAAIEVPEP